jgi:hypothetical protein
MLKFQIGNSGSRRKQMLTRRSIHWLFLAIALLVAIPAASPGAFAQISVGIGITVGFAPPPLPVYVQPVIPGPGFIWVPGYWAYGDDGYYWVPGTWVEPPTVGLLWTPGYWGWNGGEFVFNEGYWGPEIGFYGGINYGFGYVGIGYEGGYWRDGSFFYNREVNNVTNVTNITNVYNKTVVTNTTTASFNGGSGGTSAQPTAAEREAAAKPHTPPTSVQVQHIKAASTNRQLLASVNNGKPPIAATAKPGEFSGRAVVPARAAGPTNKAAETPPPGNRTSDKPGNPPPAKKAAPPPSREAMPPEHTAAPPPTHENPPPEHRAAPAPQPPPQKHEVPPPNQEKKKPEPPSHS